LAAYLLAAEREQPHGSSDQGVEARTDLTATSVEPDRRQLIADERVRMFFQLGTAEGNRLVRQLHVTAVLGAITVGLVVWWWCDIAVGSIVLWCGIICACETAITVVMRIFSSRPRAPGELARWAWIKTVVSASNGVAWSLGPILLHVSGQPISILAPVWGILNYTGAAVWDGAYFAPSIFAMLAGVTLPATIWLFYYGGDIGVITSVCLGASLPFWMGLGWLSSQKIGEAIKARLEITDLLEIQRQQTRQIRDINQDRNRFFSAASHDLRQPLHAMGFYNSLLPRASDEVERGEILTRLSECAASLDRQFNAILGVAQTDAALENAKISATPLQHIVDRVVANLQPEADMKSLQLRVVPTSLWAQVAPELLERVLSNLVSNAIKYTPNGGVLLGARPRGSHVDLVVVDSGIGIAPNDLGLIFGDFFQVGNRERNSKKGFGLGLGIVRRLCEGMGWRLEVRSTPGRGTGFGVQVPRAAPRPEASLAAEEKLAALPRNADQAAVLFVDDDALVRDAMGRMLADWDFTATLCETGREAIALLRQSDSLTRWHVLLDFRLSGEEDGLSLADRIRAEFGERVRITLMSGEASEDLQQQARQRDIVLLRKPVKPIRLRAILTSN
jgi:two-component system, sensor histidine kinase